MAIAIEATEAAWVTAIGATEMAGAALWRRTGEKRHFSMAKVATRSAGDRRVPTLERERRAWARAQIRQCSSRARRFAIAKLTPRGHAWC